MPFLLDECADALAGILEVAKYRSVCHEVPFCPFFPVLYLVSSSTVNVTPLTFPLTPAMLRLIHWNGLYSSHPDERVFVTTVRYTLQPEGVGAARRRNGCHQVCIILNAVLSLTKSTLSRRPTGWHDESGAARSGGHITVDFRSFSGTHVVTHHVYPTNNAYSRRGRRNIGSR